MILTKIFFSGDYLDILAISCDSFDPDVNRTIGRYAGPRTDHIGKLHQIKAWCEQYRVAFKMNTVVNTYNKHEAMTDQILALKPCRWKVGKLPDYLGLTMRCSFISYSHTTKVAFIIVVFQVFQCLVIDGENAGPDALRNAANFVISDEEFQAFLDLHAAVGPILVPESNEKVLIFSLVLFVYFPSNYIFQL